MKGGISMPVIGGFLFPHPPLIIPEIGRGEEKKISQTAASCRLAARQIAQLAPETIVVISPHSVMYSDYFHISPGKEASGNFARYGAPQVSVRVTYDFQFAQMLSLLAAREKLPAGTEGERDSSLDHGTMIPLTFVNEYYRDYKIVRIGLSGLPLADHETLGALIETASKLLNRRTVILASGDLSHKLTEDGPYGYAPEGPAYDEELIETLSLGALDSLREFDEGFLSAAAECGHRSLVILAGAFRNRKLDSRVLSHEGPFGVGYAAASFLPEEDACVRLARYSLETLIRDGKRAALPQWAPQELLTKQAGAFVSLKIKGALRGCIGTILPVRENLAYEIMDNAISSGTRDPRFPKVRKEELEDLTYSVDVLSPPEPISSKEELDVNKYGVIVSKGFRRGLLLPNLEGVDTVDDQISIALSKAGIDPDCDFTMERFEVVRHL